MSAQPTKQPITQNERMRRRRAAMSDEEKEAARAKARARMRKSRAKKREEQPAKPPKTEARLTASQRRQKSNARLRGMLGSTPLTDADAVIAFLRGKYLNLNTRRTYLANLIGEMRNDASFPADALAVYRAEMNVLIARIRHAYGHNTRSERDKRGWVEWERLQEAARRAPAESAEALVLALYTSVPPRRSEYRSLRVRRLQHAHTHLGEAAEPAACEITADDKSNYVVLDEAGRVAEVSLGTYKTAKRYGRQSIAGGRFSPALAAHAATKSDGEYLFEQRLRTSSSAWSRFLSQATKKWAGAPATVNILRKSFVSHLARTRPNMTSHELSAVATDMGTSVGMLRTVYRKVD